MAAIAAQPKLFNLFFACVTVIVSLAALAAGLRPAWAAELAQPEIQAVPVAPAATFALHLATDGAALPVPTAVPQLVPTAPNLPAAAHQHSAGTAASAPATSNPLALLPLAAAGGLLVAARLAPRRPSPALWPAAS